MFDKRLQVLLDEDRYQRLHDVARERGVSVAVVVREAIDRGLESPERRRQAAAAVILGAEPMRVGDPEELRAELDELRARHQ